MIEKIMVCDIDELSLLEKRVFVKPWSKEDLRFDIQSNPFAHYFCIRKHHHMIAYIGCWIKENSVEIVNLGVDPNWQKKGYAKQIIEEVMSLMQQGNINVWTLEVRKSNYRAISLYKHFGFKEVACRKNYYQDTGEDAYLMLLEVK